MLYCIRCTSVYSKCVIFDVDFLDDNLQINIGKANVIVRKLMEEEGYDFFMTTTSTKKYRNRIKNLIDEVGEECKDMTRFIFQEDNNIITKK